MASSYSWYLELMQEGESKWRPNSAYSRHCQASAVLTLTVLDCSGREELLLDHCVAVKDLMDRLLS